MPECARCGAFTDNPAEGDYHYCDDCLDRFDEIRKHGVIVQSAPDENGYEVYVSHDTDRFDGGRESNQTDALARGKYIADELGVDGLFKYDRSGSQWLLEEYLKEHPSVRSNAMDRLSRVPENSDKGLFDKLRTLFSG